MTIQAVKLNPGNIWSGSRQLAVLTCPTELAFKKGNLKFHYPMQHRDETYADAESLYQHLSKPYKNDIKRLKQIMIYVLKEKLKQYPVLFQTITLSGGTNFICACSHRVYGRAVRWEGNGRDSGFIDCLFEAYVQLMTDGLNHNEA